MAIASSVAVHVTSRRSKTRRGVRRVARPRSATAARRCWRVDTATSTASTASWNIARTAAPPTSPSCVARRAISTSMVGLAGPPRMATTPNEVNVNRKVTDEAAHSAGRRTGSTTWRRTCDGDAPRVRAAAVRSVGSTPHMPPTMRTTTAMLKYTWARITALAVDCHPPGNTARNAAPTTTVGSMKGTVTAASSTRRPGKRNRASTYAGTIPTTKVSAVLASACHRVNHSTPPSPGAAIVWAIVPGRTTFASSAASGHA